MIDDYKDEFNVEQAVFALLIIVWNNAAPELVDELKHCHEFTIDRDSVTFTLRGLYDAVVSTAKQVSTAQLEHPADKNASTSREPAGNSAASVNYYKSNTLGFDKFRAALFASRVNERLATTGLTLSVAVSTGKVSTNRYQLTLLD